MMNNDTAGIFSLPFFLLGALAWYLLLCRPWGGSEPTVTRQWQKSEKGVNPQALWVGQFVEFFDYTGNYLKIEEKYPTAPNSTILIGTVYSPDMQNLGEKRSIGYSNTELVHTYAPSVV